MRSVWKIDVQEYSFGQQPTLLHILRIYKNDCSYFFNISAIEREPTRVKKLKANQCLEDDRASATS